MPATAAKRASAINVGMGWLLLTLPIPDGTISQGDRQNLLGEYSGIAAASATLVGLEGIEYAATGDPLHFEAPWTPLEYAAGVNRLHFEAQEGDT